MIEPINAHVRPDVYVPGNWDFGNEAVDDGSARALVDALDAPVLANNWRDQTGERLYDGYTLLERAGHTIGVVGMTNPYVDRMAPAFHAGKYTFGKSPTLLDRSARRAREAGAEFVVAVTEIGLPWTVQAAKDFESVDLSLSAHTHEYTSEPITVPETETTVVESGMGGSLGRIDLRFDDGPAIRHVLYSFAADAPYTPAPDEATQRTVARLRAPFLDADPDQPRGVADLHQPIDTVVGETERPLARQAFLESPVNTLLNDALREATDADLAVSHGNRYGLAIPAGEITLEDLYTLVPITAPVAVGDAWGQQLRAHVEEYLVDNFTPHVYDQEDGRVRAFSSNVTLDIDPTAKRGRRLVSMTVDGEPIDPEATYRVASFKRPGTTQRQIGGCNFPFRAVRELDRAPIDVLGEYLQVHSPVDVGVEGLVTATASGGPVQNTPADGAYPFIQPGVDYAGGEAYVETSMIPARFDHPSVPERD
jgi:2',3'-cyclic-nucleotide 2'-phosphodiesterase (5'-nucleotidase family)